MKAAPNGGINLSVLDGWWREGYNGSNGWAIGAEIDNGTTDFQNEVDASSLYQLLENQNRSTLLRETGWQTSSGLAATDARINPQHILQHPADGKGIHRATLHSGREIVQENFSRDGCGAATHLSQWKTQIRKVWPAVKISDVQMR